MPRISLIVLLLTCLFGPRPQVQGKSDDVYLVYYATYGGKTGHVGLAIDKSEVRITDCAACPGGVRYDTVRTGELVYFDLWPARENYSYSFFFGAVEPEYYRLPSGPTAPPVTVRSLLDRGIPHALNREMDGLARIPTTPTRDLQTVAYLQAIVDEARPFDLYDFNCSDFALTGLERLLGPLAGTDEPVLTRRATTPNRLWRSVAAHPRVVVVRDPGARADGSFNAERIFSLPQTNHHEN